MAPLGCQPARSLGYRDGVLPIEMQCDDPLRWRIAYLLAARHLRAEEPLVVVAARSLNSRVVGRIGLDQHPTSVVAPAGPP